MKISVSVTDMLLQIYRYRQKYRLAEYIGIGIGWTHIGLTLVYGHIWDLHQAPTQFQRKGMVLCCFRTFKNEIWTYNHINHIKYNHIYQTNVSYGTRLGYSMAFK